MSSRSCPRCQRPLPADAPGGPCPDCLATASAHPTPAGPDAAGGPTRSAPEPDPSRVAELPLPRHFLSTGRDADGTLTPPPDSTTATHGGSAPDARDYLPAAPPGYELIRQLGEGGYGSVFLARERAAERTVAIKFLHAPGSPTAYDRFLGEVRALARLDHPNVVRVFTVETNWREPFFTMEYAAGGTLADLVAEGRPLPDPADAARLVLAAADGVAAVHAAGILHRDLKPSNVLLADAERGIRNAESGQERGGSGPDSEFRVPHSALTPKVSDFGLAKRTDRDDGLTRTGPLGTPGYMSPEAAEGRFREIDARSDVYGLGVTLYHLLTGRPPFAGRTPAEVVARVIAAVPERPRAVRPEVPAELEAVVVRAMEKDPAKRYATVEEFAADLRRVREGQPPDAPVLTWRRRARRWLVRNRWRVAVVTALLLAAAGGVWSVLPPLPPTEAIRKELAAGRRVPLLRPDGQPRWSAWPLGPAELEGSPADGGTCSFHSRDARVLLLLDDPGVERYRVRAELLWKRKAGDVAEGQNNPNTDGIGLVVGFGSQARADETSLHSMMVLGYSEFDPGGRPGPPKRALTLADLAVVDRPLWPRDILQKRGVNVPLGGPDPGGPPWREVELTVTPDGVRLRGAKPYAAADIARRRNDLGSKLSATPAAWGEPPPPWSPRMPLGVWSLGSWVAVRNVTIERLD